MSGYEAAYLALAIAGLSVFSTLLVWATLRTVSGPEQRRASHAPVHSAELQRAA